MVCCIINVYEKDRKAYYDISVLCMRTFFDSSYKDFK